jgi:16S rRNA (adenine1518-N6/adenine1519-N6)-dimethyltransferase
MMKSMKWGQHFLINKNAAEKIVTHFLPVEGSILEVGPGKGILTDLLVKYRKNNKITAVELDRELVSKLKRTYGKDVEVVNGNILKVNLPSLFPDEKKINLISSVPYYISSDFIDWVISQARYIKKAVLMMQKEFVDRLTARPFSRETHAQSIVFQFLFHLEKAFDLNPGSFSPRPKVKSTVFLFEPIAKDEDTAPESRINIEDFYRFLQSCFRNRRKTLLNNLETYHHREHIGEVFKVHGINPKIRAEQLTPGDFLKIYQHLCPGISSRL